MFARLCASRSLGVALGLSAIVLLTAFAPAWPRFDVRIDQILRESRTPKSAWGIHVQDVQTGQVVYSLNSDQAMVPASNQKLLTAATALDALGRHYRYETRLHFTGTIRDGVMRGDLIIEGSGDPTFGSTEIEAADPLQTWAERIAAMGVTRFEGRLVGDDRVFSPDRHPATWNPDHIVDKAYAPASSGLSYHDNLVHLRFQAPGYSGPIAIEARPSDYLNIESRVTVDARRRRSRLRLQRPLGTETVRFNGVVRRYYRGSRTLPVYDPTRFALHSFQRHLEAAGLEVEAEVAPATDLPKGTVLEKEWPLFVHQSPPLWEIVTIMNKESDNLYAEQLYRTFSPGGTLDGGAYRVASLLEEAGVPTTNVAVEDGSGLSRANRIPTGALVQLLSYMYRHPEREAFLATLPRGGEAQTTLDDRLEGIPVQAKTGTLRAVRTLSGYVTLPNGHPAAFAIFVNNYQGRSAPIKDTIDEIVTTLTTE